MFVPYVLNCVTDEYCVCVEGNHHNKTLRSYCTPSVIFWISDCLEDPKSDPIMLEFIAKDHPMSSGILASVRFEYDGGQYLGSFLSAPQDLSPSGKRLPWYVYGCRCVGHNVGCVMDLLSL